MVRQGLALAGIGVCIGVAGAAAPGRTLSGLLYEVGVLDVGTLAGIALLLAGTAVTACWLPARRAASVDPMVALRHD